MKLRLGAEMQSPVLTSPLSLSLIRARAWEPLVSLIVLNVYACLPNFSGLQSFVALVEQWDGKVRPGAPGSAEGKEGCGLQETMLNRPARTWLARLQFSFTLTPSGRRFLVLTHLYVSLPHANHGPRFGKVTLSTGNLMNLFFHLNVSLFFFPGCLILMESDADFPLMVIRYIFIFK